MSTYRGFQIAFENDPAGYSAGTIGYLVEADPSDGRMWQDGGFHSHAHAADAARNRIDQIIERE